MKIQPTVEEVLNAIQQKVNELGAKQVFDMIDDNKSGRVSPDELAKTLRGMGLELDDAKAEEIIKMLNARQGSKRKALTYDMFCIAFAKGTVHGGVIQHL